MRNLANTSTTKWPHDHSDTIEYKFNSSGFRSNTEYTFKPDYVFFGCSSVFGTGVKVSNVFPSYFANSMNFGIDTVSHTCRETNFMPYTNKHILDTILNFNKSNLVNKDTVGAVVWTDRPYNNVDSYIKACNHVTKFKLFHFKIGEKTSSLAEQLKPEIDKDVTKTHGGPKTHKLWYYQILKRFKQ